MSINMARLERRLYMAGIALAIVLIIMLKV